MFDPLQQTIRAYNLSAREHDRKWFHSDVVRSFVTHLAESLPPRASALDVGCGSGRDSLQLLEYGLDVVGIDLSEEMVNLARFKSEALLARQMDARRITFPDSIFDGILSVATLHHVFDDDLATALHEFHRVLKPSGLAHLTFKLGEGVASDTHGRVTQFRSEVESKNALQEAGFDVLGCVQCVDAQGRPWLQIQAKVRKPALEKGHFACPFCVPYLNIENRADGLPCAGSILWGDNDLFVVIDRSPLIEGHLLICTKRHVNSSLEFDGGEAKLNACKARVRDMLNRIY
jgi:ubiquinone/menaquinone biosynthesis C-methylase UbiE